MLYKFVIILAVVFIAEAKIASYYGNNQYNQGNNQYIQEAEDRKSYEEEQQPNDYYAYPKYKYSYGVEDHKTGDYKTHKEERDGDVVKGEYSVADPDGTIRTVRYTVDKHSGFQAVVTTTKADPGISRQFTVDTPQHQEAPLQYKHTEPVIQHKSVEPVYRHRQPQQPTYEYEQPTPVYKHSPIYQQYLDSKKNEY